MSNSAHTSDFLDRIVSKALGSDSTVAPRLPSLYEPIAEAGVGSGIDASPCEAEISAGQVEISSARTAVQQQKEISTAAASGVVPRDGQMSTPKRAAVTRGPESAIVAADTSDQAWSEPTDAMTPIPENLDNGPVATAYPRALSALAAPLPEARPKPPAGTPPAAAAETAAFVMSDAPLHSEGPSALVDGLGAHSIDAEPQNLRTSRFPVMIAKPITLHPLPEPSLRETRNLEPVIQVTIGRVEVRATQQPGPLRTQRSAPQPMRLDEYLNKRGGHS
jgi:hypothetical protein